MGSRPHRYTSSKASKKIFHYVIYTAVFFSALLLYVFQHIQAIRYGYAVEQKRKEVALLRMENDRILMDIKNLTSLSRLEQLAYTKMGLKVAGNEEIVVIMSPKSSNGGTSLLNKTLNHFKAK